MVEIEEIKGGGDENNQLPPPPPGMKRKKDLPSVAHLLAHGSEESKNRPQTFCSLFGYPLFVAVCFAISLLAFHYTHQDQPVHQAGEFSKLEHRLPPNRMVPAGAEEASPPLTITEATEPTTREDGDPAIVSEGESRGHSHKDGEEGTAQMESPEEAMADEKAEL